MDDFFFVAVKYQRGYRFQKIFSMSAASGKKKHLQNHQSDKL
jgi:hypothetical protein